MARKQLRAGYELSADALKTIDKIKIRTGLPKGVIRERAILLGLERILANPAVLIEDKQEVEA